MQANNEKPSKGRILLMDDDEIIRSAIKGLLNNFGYETDTCADGSEALEMYTDALRKKSPYDAVILDLAVPGGMGGKQTIKKLLEIDPNVKAVVSSGYSDESIINNFAEIGFSACIEKPYRIEVLDKTLTRIIQNKTS